MRILGLTGSIGMGKSTAAALLRHLGVPVHDADAAVHSLMAAGGGAVAAVEAAFPGSTVAGAVDRQKLGARVFGNRAALARLEGILHPLVRRRTRRFLQHHARRCTPLVVLDIPLLFETGGEGLCDAVVVVSAPHWLQAQRVMRRAGMTLAKFEAIREHQMPDAEKRRRAQFVVNTGLTKHNTLVQLAAVVDAMQDWPQRPDAVRRWSHA